MMSQPDLIIGNNKVAGLIKVFSIYGDITGNKKLYNDAISLKIKAHITQLKTDQFFIENMPAIWEGLSPKHKENITNFMK